MSIAELNEIQLTCPVCGQDLHQRAASLCCASGHAFDIAREGYVNLHVPQHRAKGIQGDPLAMVQARRRFLDAGHYLPLSEALIGCVNALVRERGGAFHARVIEVGCGEGYFISALAKRLDPRKRAIFAGTDISKSAIRLAAKRHRDILFFVADVNRSIYLRTGSMSLLLDVFAPRNSREFARVLEPGGAALIVIPSDRHLVSLREALGLIGIESEKERRVVERFAGDFQLEDRQLVQFPLRLGGEAVKDLVDMGPNYWHHAPGQPTTAGGQFETEASFVVLRFQSRSITKT